MGIFDNCPEGPCDPCAPDYLSYRGDVIQSIAPDGCGWAISTINLETGVTSQVQLDGGCCTVDASQITGLCDLVQQCIAQATCVPPTNTITIA